MDPVAYIVSHFSRSLNSPCPLATDGKKWDRQKIGDFGEKLALRFLQKKGWKLLYRNYRGPRGGEVDLVMRGGEKRDLLVFIEVKTRTYRGYGRPLDAVNAEKQSLIERGANHWLKELGRRDVPWRFDVVEVMLEKDKIPVLTLVEDAF